VAAVAPIDIFRAANIVGEGILWDARRQTLWWTDIQGRCLHRYDWARGTTDVIGTPDRVGSFGLIAAHEELIVAFANGIAFYNPFTKSTESLPDQAALESGVRFNDGRVDRQGRFWAGTMVEGPQAEAHGRLYSVDATCRVRCEASGIRIANGLCFSPDGTRMYFADSPTRTIHVYEVTDLGGSLGPPRLFAHTPHGAYPDGAAVDADGCVWSSLWGAGCVVRYTPHGIVDRILPIPTRQPSCVCFAGPDLDVLCVTSAREGLDEATLGEEPHAGDVFLYRLGVQGLPESEYKRG
jgi:sugar lactone lactonase YvrE